MTRDPAASVSTFDEEDSLGVRVRVHPGLCEGWGNCHRFAPAVYPLDAEGYVDIHLLEVPADMADAARLGALACPAGAITVIERWGARP
jgi:ferredoxin